MKILETSVVGIEHRVTHLTQQKLAELAPFPVKLKREPRNQHDRNAVKVIVHGGEFDGLHIGYVPRGVASTLSPKMRARKVVVKSAKVTDFTAGFGDADLKIRYFKPEKENT